MSVTPQPDRETRRRPCGRVQCPKCHRPFTLWQETDEWIQARTGRWRHCEYGPPTGECCGVAYLDSFDGMIYVQIGEGRE